MSRIGKQPIIIPAGVKVRVADGKVFVEGPKGKLDLTSRDPADLGRVDAPAKIDWTSQRPGSDHDRAPLPG